eukprot:3939793-Rhodomonas_salina.1
MGPRCVLAAALVLRPSLSPFSCLFPLLFPFATPLLLLLLLFLRFFLLLSLVPLSQEGKVQSDNGTQILFYVGLALTAVVTVVITRYAPLPPHALHVAT